MKSCQKQGILRVNRHQRQRSLGVLVLEGSSNKYSSRKINRVNSEAFFLFGSKGYPCSESIKLSLVNSQTKRKLVETLIDDEFVWNEDRLQYEPNGFTDCFEHTGNERCAECEAGWTGA